MGDELRTTCLLPVIGRVWPGMRLTWITRAESIQLLGNNQYIDEVLPYGPDAMVHLAARMFDKVLNLDAGRISATLASMAKTKEKIGYILSDEGFVIGTNPAAEDWLKMGIFDDLKKAKQRTYQEIKERFIELIGKLNRELGQSGVILLLGGPEEKELNNRILSKVGPCVID